jgi:hypothetical protein
VLAVLAVLAVGVASCGSRGGSSAAKASVASPPSSASGSSADRSSGDRASRGDLAVASPPALPESASAAGAATGVASTGSGAALGAAVAPATADIVESGRLDVQVRTPAALRAAYAAIGTLAGAEGGFVSSSTLTNAKRPTASMTLRIPDRTVGTVTVGIRGLGRVTSETMSGQDVSGQVVDLAVEITNLTSEESAVRHLLSDAGSVRNILTVQQQLFALQDEIQQLTAQSNSLDDRIRYATVAVALTTVAPVAAPIRHHTTTIARFRHLAGAHTVALVRGLFLAIGWSAPGIGLLVLLGGAIAALRHRRRGPQAVATGPDPTA